MCCKVAVYSESADTEPWLTGEIQDEVLRASGHVFVH